VEIEVVTGQAGVDAVVAAARDAGRCAIDTEFVWERTYAPALCLVQVAAGDRVFVNDPLRGAPAAPVASLVADAAVEKVMHAPSGDLAAFHLEFGARPASIYDVQLAAGFAGLGGSLSLERLVEATVGVRLQHDEGFTDWQRRPLSETQVRYAADDVRYLVEAADVLAEQLERSGRTGWAAQEMERRWGPSAEVVQSPENAWRRVSGRGRLGGEQLTVLMAVAAWREREARRQNVPASWLMRDPTLVEVARRRPRTPEQAEAVRGLRVRRRQMQGLLAAVEEGLSAPPVRIRREASPEVRRRIRAVLPLATAVLQARCGEAGIASELVATRDDLESLIRGLAEGDEASTQTLLSGWRFELAGESLRELLEGRVALAVVPGPPHVEAFPLEARGGTRSPAVGGESSSAP
jgi:ribonuclease D